MPPFESLALEEQQTGALAVSPLRCLHEGHIRRQWFHAQVPSSGLSYTCLVGGLQELAVLLQSRVSEVLHVDIHPAASIGRGILMDHATGIVIGETAVVGDNCSLLHQVTLGGSGSGKGVRHPHIGVHPGLPPSMHCMSACFH